MTTARPAKDEQVRLDGRLAEVLDTVPDGITVLDRSGTVRFANAAAARLMGLVGADEVIGRRAGELSGLFELLDADGGPFDMSRMPTRRAFAGEVEADEVIRFRDHGSLDDRWSLVRARLLAGPAPEEDLVITAFQDISALKRSEARLRFLAEANSALGEAADYHETLNKLARICVPRLADWCVVDILEDGERINRVAVAHADPGMVGLAEELRRRWPPDPARPGAVSETLRARRSLHITDMSDEMLAAAAQDEEHLAVLRRLGIGSVLVVPLEARGQVLGALSLVRSGSGRPLEDDDIALAEELGRSAGVAVDSARLVRNAQETARIRDEFIAVASHDMRTPLAAVRGYAQLGRRNLASGQPDLEMLDGWLAEIDAVTGRLTELVAELMDASLIHGGQEVPLQAQPTDLGRLCAAAIERRSQLSEMHRFSLASGSDGSDGPVGMWDPARLGRVLENLLDNAVKYSPDGGEITVRVGTAGGRAFASVTDHGIGIAASELGLIFSPMYRGRNARGTVGTGLGLAGSRHLIEQMGGAISVESALGQGSTFTVWLPADGDVASGGGS